MGRINTAEPRGGFIMLRDTFRYNLGLDLHHWVRLGFSGFERAINLLGGIEVLATAPLNDECGGVQWHYQAGKTYTMDGFAALCYARMRKRSSDFDRLRRQQEILIAIFQRIISLDGLQRVPELYGTFQPTFESDMQLRQVLDLLPLAVQVARQPERLIPARIDPRMAHGWRVPGSGAALLLPDRPALTAYLWELFRPQSAPPQVPLQWR
jgi:LCP family protein required for cell wall assembly